MACNDIAIVKMHLRCFRRVFLLFGVLWSFRPVRASYTPCRDATECQSLSFHYCDQGLEVCVHCSRMCSRERVATSSRRAERCENECADFMKKQREETTTVKPSTTTTTSSAAIVSMELKNLIEQESDTTTLFMALLGAIVVLLVAILVCGVAILCKLNSRGKTKSENKPLAHPEDEVEAQALIPKVLNNAAGEELGPSARASRSGSQDGEANPPSYHSGGSDDEIRVIDESTVRYPLTDHRGAAEALGATGHGNPTRSERTYSFTEMDSVGPMVESPPGGSNSLTTIKTLSHDPNRRDSPLRGSDELVVGGVPQRSKAFC